MQKRLCNRFGKSKTGETVIAILGYAVIFILCALLFSLIATKMKNPLPYLSIFSFAAFLTAGFFGSFLAAKCKREQKWQTAILSGSFAAALALLLPLFLGSHIGANTLLSVLAFFVAVILGCVFGCMKKKRRLHR